VRILHEYPREAGLIDADAEGHDALLCDPRIAELARDDAAVVGRPAFSPNISAWRIRIPSPAR
jgi:hypothetical protein